MALPGPAPGHRTRRESFSRQRVRFSPLPLQVVTRLLRATVSCTTCMCSPTDNRSSPTQWKAGLAESSKWPFPMPKARSRAGVAGGKEIFYLRSNDDVMSVDMTVRGESLEFSPPKRLFTARSRYAAGPDGQRFAYVSAVARQISGERDPELASAKLVVPITAPQTTSQSPPISSPAPQTCSA